MKNQVRQFTRRQAIRSLAAGGLLLPGLLSEMLQGATNVGGPLNPLSPKSPHFKPKAKRVIFLFMTGGVSHVDTFDPKPLLTKNHGKPTTTRAFTRSGLGIQTLRPKRCAGQRPIPAHR